MFVSPGDRAGRAFIRIRDFVRIAANNIFTGNNTFNRNVFIKGPLPWADVRAFGATGAGVADDTTAFQNALASGASIVYVPGGTYKITASLTVPDGVTLMGAGSISSILQTTGDPSPALINVTGQYAVVSGLNVSGGGIGSANPTIRVAPAAVGVILENLLVAGGFYALDLLGTDTSIIDVFPCCSYGLAVVHVNAGLWFRRVKIDQSWPVGTGVTTIGVWTAGHAYVSGDAVTVPSGYILQCVTGGTSGGGAPVPVAYFAAIPDNTVVWNLVSASTYYGLYITAPSVGEIQLIQVDLTGSYTHGIHIDGGTITNLKLNQSVVSQCYSAAIWGEHGSEVYITDSELGGAGQTGAATVTINSAFTGGMFLTNNQIAGGTYAIFIAGGANYGFSNNHIDSATYGVYVNSNLNSFVINGNVFTNIGGNAVNVQAGTGNHFNIVNNIGGSISNAAGGANVTISGNN